MIEEILKFRNPGTPNYLLKIFLYVDGGDYTEKNIKDFFYNNFIDNKFFFDGGVATLKAIGLLKVSSDNILIIPDRYKYLVKYQDILQGKIINLLLNAISKDQLFNMIFDGSHMYYEPPYGIIINNSAFRFKYSKLKQLLIDFKIIIPHSIISNQYRIMESYIDFFSSIEISKNISSIEMSLDEFKRLNELKEGYGEDAENFVLKYEIAKFKFTNLVKYIEKISDLNVAAGFDIISVHGINSSSPDKFIEVKSYSGSLNFYWSKNEVRVAKEERNNYFLYLVNRDEMNDIDYSPIMIQNPFESVFNNKEWSKEPQSWKFEQKVDGG